MYKKYGMDCDCVSGSVAKASALAMHVQLESANDICHAKHCECFNQLELELELERRVDVVFSRYAVPSSTSSVLRVICTANNSCISISKHEHFNENSVSHDTICLQLLNPGLELLSPEQTQHKHAVPMLLSTHPFL